MTMQLRKAERKQARLRIGMAGPSGSGKTYSALKLARGLTDGWDKIALIDTENKRGDLYAHLGDYNIITLEAPFTPERFIESIKACEAAGMDVIIIDSSSHEWDGSGGCLEANDRLAQTKFKGNTWAAWSETTPRHQKFIEAIIASPCHIITTMRSKTDTIQTDDKKIKKVGLKEIQREGFEYELTVSFNIDRDTHYAMVGKDNTEVFKGSDPFMIDIEHGKKIREWNESGKADLLEQKKEIIRQLKRFDLPVKTADEIAKGVMDNTGLALEEENYQAIIAKLRVMKAEQIKRPTPPQTPPPAAPVQTPQAEVNDDASAPSNPHVATAPVLTPEGIKAEAKELRAKAPKPSDAKLNLFKTLLEQKEGIGKEDSANQLGYLMFIENVELDSLSEMTLEECDRITQKLMNKKTEAKTEQPAV